MSDDKTASTQEGTESNTPVGEPEAPQQTPDQFYNPEVERAKADAEVPANHATKGMTTLGYTEASRIENTAEFQEQERRAADKAAAKAARKG